MVPIKKGEPCKETKKEQTKKECPTRGKNLKMKTLPRSQTELKTEKSFCKQWDLKPSFVWSVNQIIKEVATWSSPPAIPRWHASGFQSWKVCAALSARVNCIDNVSWCNPDLDATMPNHNATKDHYTELLESFLPSHSREGGKGATYVNDSSLSNNCCQGQCCHLKTKYSTRKHRHPRKSPKIVTFGDCNCPRDGYWGL